MATINVRLKDAAGNVLYPETDWSVVQNKPWTESFNIYVYHARSSNGHTYDTIAFRTNGTGGAPQDNNSVWYLTPSGTWAGKPSDWDAIGKITPLIQRRY